LFDSFAIHLHEVGLRSGVVMLPDVNPIAKDAGEGNEQNANTFSTPALVAAKLPSDSMSPSSPKIQ
jgi:hypothetical protein